MRSRTSGVPIGRYGQAAHVMGQALKCLLFAAISGGLLWLVWIYANGLRDPRFLDGWVLAGGMALQISFHIGKKIGLSPKSATRWQKIHIFAGYLVIAAFASHSGFSLPDTGFEWALWSSFALVTLSGIFGTYLAWSVQAKGRVDEGISYDRIPMLRAELERSFLAAVAETDPRAATMDLPGLPYDDWINELCTAYLVDFFKGQSNFTAHLIGSQRPLKEIIHAIDNLSRYVDQQSQVKLAAIRKLAVEKDRLDFARVSLGLTRGWLFVHVPITYSLIVLSFVHVVVVYAFSWGTW